MAAANEPAPPTSGANAGSIQAAPQAASTDIQAPPDGIRAEPPIPLPKRPQPAYLIEEQAQGIARLNQAIVAVVLVLAFLLASFAVRNSDFWMHLASGRAQLQGTYNPIGGTDPFAYTTPGGYWANHAWLFDALLYLLYTGLGGPALVVLKGLLVVALAWVLLHVRRPGQDPWVPAVCTGLALLALTPRLDLRPLLLTYLFLAITLWLLYRPAPGKAVWFLPPLFVLWVNVDGWFLLGLLAVALYVLGELLETVLPLPGDDAAPPADAARVGRLALVLAASVAACLVNPYTYHAFTLPQEFSFGQPASLLAKDPRLGILFASPFAESYWGDPRVGGNFAGLAFFPLVVVGLASFAVAWPRWRCARVLLWLAFFLLAAYRWHAVPFFAVVGGPIAALNFGDYAARPARRAVPLLALAAVLPVAGVLLFFGPAQTFLPGHKRIPTPELVWYGILLVAIVARLAWWLLMAKRQGAGPAAGGPAARTWVAAVQIALVLAVLIAAAEFATHTTFYTDKLAWPQPPLTFLVFAGFLIGALAFGVAPTAAYADRVFLNWSLSGRVLTLLAGLGLLVAAWPGWLTASRQDPARAHRVAWAVEPDPSLAQVARHLDQLRREQAIKATDEGLVLSLPAASYCAWFCPGERSFFDHRFGLFPEVAATYLDLRETLEPDLAGLAAAESGQDEEAAQGAEERLRALAHGRKGALARLAETFRQYHINHLVLSTSDSDNPPETLLVRMIPLLLDTGQWRLIYLDGRSAVFGWKDPAAAAGGADPWAPYVYDTVGRAYGAATPEPGPRKVPPDPVHEPAWGRYESGSPPRPLKVDEAEVHLSRFRMLAEPSGPSTKETARIYQAALAAGWVGSANPTPGPMAVGGLLRFRAWVDTNVLPLPPVPGALQRGQPNQVAQQVALAGRRLFFFGRDDAPPALPLLAIRAARQAVVDNPQDVTSYLGLAAAYSSQRQQTRERAWCGQMPELAVLRQAQMAAALQHALTVRPDLPEVHAELADLYLHYRNEQNGNQGYLDLRLKHLREMHRLLKRAGRQPGEAEDDYKKRLEPLEKELKDLGKLVKDNQNHYEVAASSRKVLDRARDALHRGLAEQALNVLLESDVIEFGPQGAQLELELLLTMGRVEDARRLLNDPNAPVDEGLGERLIAPYVLVPAYTWYQLLLAGAEGDYDETDKQFARLLEAQDALFRQLANRQLFLPLASNLTETSKEMPLGWQASRYVRRWAEVTQMAAVGVPLQTKAQLTVLRGLLALEAGDTARAQALFREALATAFPPQRGLPFLSLLGAGSPPGAAALLPASIEAASGPVFDFNGRTMAVRCLQLMDEAATKKK
jgi:hypothetical protein